MPEQPTILPFPAAHACCQLCNSMRLHRFEVPGRTTLWRCAECRLFQNGPLVSSREYDAEYQRSYLLSRPRKLKTAIPRMRQLLPLIDRFPGRLLDIGCSVGCMLEAAERENYKAVGVDVSEEAVGICRARSLDAILADGCSLPFASESFDAVTAWHVVEHVRDIKTALSEWHRVLRPGGVLVLETPDASYIKARVLGTAFRKFWPPHHTYTFTRRTLVPFLERASYAVERPSILGRLSSWSTLSGYGALYGAYQGARQLVGLQKNLQLVARKKPLVQSLARKRQLAA